MDHPKIEGERHHILGFLLSSLLQERLSAHSLLVAQNNLLNFDRRIHGIGSRRSRQNGQRQFAPLDCDFDICQGKCNHMNKVKSFRSGKCGPVILVHHFGGQRIPGRFPGLNSPYWRASDRSVNTQSARVFNVETGERL